MVWDISDVSQALGVEPFLSRPDSPTGDIYMFDFSGPRLNYGVWIQPDVDYVMVSGDPVTPFGGHSFYEVYVACGSIWRTVDTYRHPHGTKLEDAEFFGLDFCTGPEHRIDQGSLTLLFRPDGDLKVWPAYPLPESHPLSEATEAGGANRVGRPLPRPD